MMPPLLQNQPANANDFTNALIQLIEKKKIIQAFAYYRDYRPSLQNTSELADFDKSLTALFKKVNRLQPFQEKTINIDHTRKFLFVHIPKGAGTSVKKALGLPDGPADHGTPTDMVHAQTWEAYFTFTVVRNPIDRFISSYRYHADPLYQGYVYKKFPHLHSMSLEEYFDAVGQTEIVRPQVDYIRHKYSNKPMDRICRFEHLDIDLAPVFNHLKINTAIPHLNRSDKKKSSPDLEQGLRNKLLVRYQDDFKIFGYDA
ncbi:MAG: hypothetical protein A2293_07300 [Elusimicrobia bacterium RIFOXYB2_FULL_49_7]|nr:MAG: hypothetical protein A2293_07300 [Elusimicrobia bacterium RIFOXYB2_FULL_49_7]